MKQGERERTPYAAACEISRELELGLSNGQVEDLARFLAGFEDGEAAGREVLAKGRAGARELVRALRAG